MFMDIRQTDVYFRTSSSINPFDNLADICRFTPKYNKLLLKSFSRIST